MSADSSSPQHARHPLPGSLVHDLRTPLGQIIGYTELLIEEAEDAGEERSLGFLRKVRAAGLQMLSLIEEEIEPIPDEPRGVDLASLPKRS